MFRNPRYLARRIAFISAATLPLCLLLAACGGGGSEVASIPPPPPTPTPAPAKPTSFDVQTSWLPSPATRAGSYDLIAIVGQTVNGAFSSRVAAPAEFTLAAEPVASVAFNYELNGPTAFLPAGQSSLKMGAPADSWDFNLGGPNYRYDNPYGDYVQNFGQNLKEYEIYADGSKSLREDYDLTRSSFSGRIVSLPSGGSISEGQQLDIGYSYVAMGEWDWRPVAIDSNGKATPTGSPSSIYFAYGDRTPAPGIPVSGTATYDARSLALKSRSTTFGIPFGLSADFGQRTISARIDQDYRFDPTFGVDDPIEGIHVAGAAPFTNTGTFDVPLTGTANYSAFNASVTPPSEAVTGMMNGAFFGPHAEQVGGTFSVNRSGGALLMQDAFVGQQHKP